MRDTPIGILKAYILFLHLVKNLGYKPLNKFPYCSISSIVGGYKI